MLAGYLRGGDDRLAKELKRRTIDLHSLLYQATGRRYALDSVARETLGQAKFTPPANGDPILLAEYCERDVELTRDLDDFRRQYGLLYVLGGRAVQLLQG